MRGRENCRMSCSISNDPHVQNPLSGTQVRPPTGPNVRVVIQPGTGLTTKPGVVATRRTPGNDELRTKPQRGFTRSAANAKGDCGTPFGVQTPDVVRNPGCAAPRRPWALLCNPAGVLKIGKLTKMKEQRVLGKISFRHFTTTTCLFPRQTQGTNVRVWSSIMENEDRDL